MGSWIAEYGASAVAAGVVARLGTGLSRWADGMKINILKSGENRNVAFSMAKGMRVGLREVFIVPSGKGHLTNAFGSRDAVGITNNLGRFLNREQIRFVIAHELSHVKLRHERKQLLFASGMYVLIAFGLFISAPVPQQYRSSLSVAVILLPLLLRDWFSRRLEFAADQEAVRFTREPETAIRALARLLRSNDLPPQRGSFIQLFTTHPFFLQRARAVARFGDVSNARLNKILAEERVEGKNG
jgi:Zn-dependent protease with chaperone function